MSDVENALMKYRDSVNKELSEMAAEISTLRAKLKLAEAVVEVAIVMKGLHNREWGKMRKNNCECIFCKRVRAYDEGGKA